MLVPVIVEVDGGFCGAWERKRHGAPSEKNLEAFVERYARSFQKGGINYHVTQRRGYYKHPSKARIVCQETNKILAEWKAPAVKVWW